MSQRNRYSDEIKAECMAALLAGQSVSEVADKYNIPRGTVCKWSSRKNVIVKESEPEPKREIGDLLLDYLRATITTLKSQAEVFGEKDWIRRQPASELAVLHGVAADKAIRLLEALVKRDEAEAETGS